MLIVTVVSDYYRNLNSIAQYLPFLALEASLKYHCKEEDSVGASFDVFFDIRYQSVKVVSAEFITRLCKSSNLSMTTRL